MKDGEQHKSMRSLEQRLRFSANPDWNGMMQLVALGGGVVGDLAGLRGGYVLRGGRFHQRSTTLLAQIDASVAARPHQPGAGEKIWSEAFHQPRLSD